MKEFEINVFVATLNDEIVDIKGIDDGYTHIQVSLDIESLVRDDLDIIYHNMSNEFRNSEWNKALDYGYLHLEDDAMHLNIGKLSKYNLSIQKIKVDSVGKILTGAIELKDTQ